MKTTRFVMNFTKPELLSSTCGLWLWDGWVTLSGRVICMQTWWCRICIGGSLPSKASSMTLCLTRCWTDSSINSTSSYSTDSCNSLLRLSIQTKIKSYSLPPSTTTKELRYMLTSSWTLSWLILYSTILIFLLVSLGSSYFLGTTIII